MAHILAVLWLILKIILWILLGILCIVLLFLICPFTYKGSFYKQEESIKASGAFHDFLFLFGMKANYQESLSVKVRILFFTVYDSSKPKEKSKSNTKSNTDSEVSDNPPVSDKNPVMSPETTFEEAKPEQVTEESKPAQENASLEPQEPGKEKENTSKWSRMIQELCNKDLTIDSVYDKIENKIDAYNRTTDLFSGPLMTHFWSVMKAEIRRVLKHILPRIKGYVEFGMEDPATTGYLLGFLATLTGIKPKNLHIYGNFDKQMLDADINCKGRIRLIVLLFVFLRVYFAGHLKEVMKQAEITKNKWRT